MKRQKIEGQFKQFLDGFRRCLPQPFSIYVDGKRQPWYIIRDAHESGLITVCLRGNSKKRRQFRCTVLRYLNAPGGRVIPLTNGSSIKFVPLPEPVTGQRDIQVAEVYTDDDYADQYCQGNPRAASVWRGGS